MYCAILLYRYLYSFGLKTATHKSNVSDILNLYYIFRLIPCKYYLILCTSLPLFPRLTRHYLALMGFVFIYIHLVTSERMLVTFGSLLVDLVLLFNPYVLVSYFTILLGYFYLVPLLWSWVLLEMYCFPYKFNSFLLIVNYL